MARIRLTAALAVVAAAWLLVPAAAWASQGKLALTTYTAMSGVPTHVAAGGTLSFTLTFRQSSAGTVELDGLPFEIWNRCLCAPDDTQGTKATFLDPSDKTWHTTTGAEGEAYPLFLTGRLVVSPGQTISIPVRVNLSHFRSGSYTVAANGTTIGSVFDANGHESPYTWSVNEAPDRYFTLGTASVPQPAGKPTPHPSASHHTAAPSTPTPIRTASSAPVSVTLSPSAASSPANSPAPQHAILADAPQRPGGSGPTRWWWLAVPVVLAAAGFALRRRVMALRPATTAAATTEPGITGAPTRELTASDSVEPPDAG